MELVDFLVNSSSQEIADKITSFSYLDKDTALQNLEAFLLVQSRDMGDRHWIARYVCRVLLTFGEDGLQTMFKALLKVDRPTATTSILECLWHVAQFTEPPIEMIYSYAELGIKFPSIRIDIAEMAKSLFIDCVIQSQQNPDLFWRLMHFFNLQAISYMVSSENVSQNTSMASKVASIFSETSIKISTGLIKEFQTLIEQDHTEETYQQFLSLHPVFLDPLASRVFPKQALGVEHITDFVIQRLDNEYILVEIEKPQDNLFTQNGDLTAKFTHAFGQVLDFQEWIDTHGEYARTLMPGISSPKGLLVMGRKKSLNQQQIGKLKRLNINSSAIEVVTFDELLFKAQNLYNNIRRNADPFR